MRKTGVNFRKIRKYLSNVITWTIFVILILCALVLGYYYISLQLYKTKGKQYEPKFSIYTIVSPSMVPTINVYDVIVNVKVDSPSDVKEGDVITFISSSTMSYGMTITHRVKEIQVVNGEYQYITKGDNNLSQDTAPCLYENIIGKTIFKLPQVGRIQFFVASKFGWLIVVVLPALIIIIKDVFKIIKLAKIKKNAEIVNNEMVMKVTNEDEKDAIN